MSEQSVGQRIKQAREQAGIRSAELARRAEISKGYLHELEHGRRNEPGLSVAARLAGVLGVSLEWLAGGIKAAPCQHGAAVYWNDVSGQVLCHRCGTVFVPTGETA